MQFDYNADYVLEDDVISVSPLSMQHLDPLLESASHPEIWHYLLEDGQSRENLAGYIEQALDDRANKKAYPFVVYHKDEERFVGSTRFYEISPLLQTMKLGYTWLGRAFWGKGINKRAKYMLFEFAFEQLGSQRIGFGVSAENERSLQALKRIGCQKEGVLRSFLPGIDNPSRIDLILMGLLKEEWLGFVKEDLNRQFNA